MHWLWVLLVFATHVTQGRNLEVGNGKAFATISKAFKESVHGDTVSVFAGLYHEGNLLINKKILFRGFGLPILDGDRKYEVLTIKADSVVVTGFRIQHSAYATLDDPGGVKVNSANYVQIIDNLLYDNFFGVYIQYGKGCRIERNKIVAFGKEEQQIGNGIHCWKSDSLVISGNQISGHRDGIYFEFVTHSVIWRNLSQSNIRYGLHFMFSNSDAYYTNVFRNNGAGVAVMFTKDVKMSNNTFDENWGDAAYGLLLKEISDSYIHGNRFVKNTTGIFMEGTNRIVVEKNILDGNGWGMKIQASCMDNIIKDNNFVGNSFDVGTNGSLVLNTFEFNYWDKYEGYDLNKDQTGDVPFHPLSLFSVLVEQNPPLMVLYRSFMIGLLDKSERLLPSLTPEQFADSRPRMKALPL
ncbi:MAG TPA: nitrous oxide reductase family maturation protein NosD [Catalimonadaceae bacterium]|nr:nitrous oxide reductase family maturation protein NosD [Catalimonadaceae bacterium]